MANRYWVGGNGTWDTASTANWSASSGGASGASAPVAADAVFFDANSGGGTCTLGENVTCLSTNLTGYTGTLAFGTNKIQCTGTSGNLYVQTSTCSVSGTPLVEYTTNVTSTATFRGISLVGVTEANSVNFKLSAGVDNLSMVTGGIVKSLDFTGFSGTFSRGSSGHTMYGDLTLSSTMAVSSGSGIITFGSAVNEQKITCNGTVINCNITVNGVGVIFEDKFLMGSSRSLFLQSGTLNANNKDVDIPSFALSSGTKTLTLGSGTWTITGSGTAWNANTNVANLTVSASTGVISMTSASAKTFAGGGKTWPTLNQGGSGALTITGANTFTSITNTVQPATITFPASTTTTVNTINVGGTAGNLITLNSSSAGTRATISNPNALANLSNVSIKDIAATNKAVFAYLFNGNTNGGNNTGIRFNLPDSSGLPSMFIQIDLFFYSDTILLTLPARKTGDSKELKK